MHKTQQRISIMCKKIKKKRKEKETKLNKQTIPSDIISHLHLWFYIYHLKALNQWGYIYMDGKTENLGKTNQYIVMLIIKLNHPPPREKEKEKKKNNTTLLCCLLIKCLKVTGLISIFPLLPKECVLNHKYMLKCLKRAKSEYELRPALRSKQTCNW